MTAKFGTDDDDGVNDDNNDIILIMQPYYMQVPVAVVFQSVCPNLSLCAFAFNCLGLEIDLDVVI